MTDPAQLDPRSILEKSSSRIPLRDLAKKGVQTVKILEEQTLFKLIKDAVDNTIATKSSLLTEEERQKIQEESRRELDRLMQEYAQIKKREEEILHDKDLMARELENLRRQLEITKKMHDERESEIANTYKPKVQELETELEKSKDEISRLKQLNTEVMSLKTQQEIQQQDELTSKLDGLSRNNELIANKLSSLFIKTIDGLTKKIHSLKLSSQQEINYKPADNVLDSVLKQELESNLAVLESMKTEQKTGSVNKIKDTIQKLKSMKFKKGLEPEE